MQINKKSQANKYYPILDTFRALAAFFVVLEHVRNFLWIDFPQLSSPSIFIEIIYFLSGLGHEFVIVFFVISGCLVGRIALDNFLEDNYFNWSKYLFARLTRLWVVLIPALVLTWCLDSISLAVAPSDSFIFKGGGYAHMSLDQILVNRIKISYFLGNIFFIQTILVPTFGSNGVLWSLANEFWYYVLFPLLLFGIFKKFNLLNRGLYIFLGFLLLQLVGIGITSNFPIWLFGVIAYYWGNNLNYSKSKIAKTLFFLSLIFTGISLITSRLAILNEFISPYAIGLTFSATLLFGLNLHLPNSIKLLSTFFSDFSFSLYIIHAPILTLLVAPWITDNSKRLNPDLLGFILLVSVIVLIYFFSYTFFYITEKNTYLIRNYLKKISLFK